MGAPGSPYQPSNGDEGMWFQSIYCDLCRHDAKYRQTDDGKYGCKLIAFSQVYKPGDAKYPKEWTHNDHGEPICTKFDLPKKRVRKRSRPKIKNQPDMF